MAQVARGEREKKKLIKIYFDKYPTLQSYEICSRRFFFW